jgi:plasmid stabilization system protein ParE
MPPDYGPRLNDDDGVQSDGYSRYSHTSSSRSMFLSLTRRGDLGRRTTSCWRRTRFSASSRTRPENGERTKSSSWSRKATIGRSIIMRQSVRHLELGFREAQRADAYVNRIVAFCKGLASFPLRGTRRDDLLPGVARDRIRTPRHDCVRGHRHRNSD